MNEATSFSKTISVSGPSLFGMLGGIEVKSGSAVELEAGIFDIGKRREAARRVGYPGKGIYTHVSAAEKADAMIAAARPEFGCLEGDGVLCAAIAEMKVDNDRLKKTAFLLHTYYNMGGLNGPLMGGYAGGPEGTSMVLVAHNFLNLMVFRSATFGYFDLHENQEIRNFGGLRPGCWINALPAGGLVLMPDASAGCVCSYQNRTWMALQQDGQP